MLLTAPSTAPPNAPDLVGRPLIANRFALFAKIAEGGMAGVYRAWDTQLRAWRALKVLLPEYAERPNLRTRFESEARALAAIDHPNVVRVFDIAANAPLPYIVMELAEGGSLNDWIERNGQMPARMAVEVTLQVARGLGAAHDAGVVHRDVKPQNVLLDARGRCLVTDFGIARVTFVDHLTRTGSSMGTVGYMAPEQRADAKVVDARADVYGLGAMLYKLVTGVVLTDLFLVEHDPKLLAPVPQVLRPVVLRACRHDRELRYQDTRELAEALEGVLEALPPLLDGIPHLGGLPDDPSIDKANQDFSSIAMLFRGPSDPRGPVHGATSAPAGPPRTPVQLPYRMPERPMMRPDTPVPLPDAGRGSGMVVDVHRRTAPATPGRETIGGGPTAPTLDAPYEPVAARPGVRAALIAAALAVVVAWFGGVLFGAWSLRGDAEAEVAARAELYRVLATEVELLPELVERGASAEAVTELSDLYETWETTSEGPARIELADRYATGALRLAQELLPQGGADMTSMRARNLGRHHLTWTRARERWRSDASGVFGRSAVLLGLGPAPVDVSPAVR